MNLPTLPTLLSLITAALVLSLASVRADGFDPRNLLILDEDNGVTYEDWVSTDPLETHTVKKVEAGRVSYVTITRTSTGTYSTDGFGSPNVQYPGVIEPANPRNEFSFSSWSNGRWNSFRTSNGNSYVSVSTYKTHRGQTRTSTCISTASFWYC